MYHKCHSLFHLSKGYLFIGTVSPAACKIKEASNLNEMEQRGLKTQILIMEKLNRVN